MTRAGSLTITAAAIAAVLVVPLAAAAPAQAVTPPAPTCNPAVDTVWEDIVTAEVDPVVTEFHTSYIAPGTTGEFSQTLQQVDSVSTTINRSLEITAEFKAVFVKAGVKAGFSVATTKATTQTTSITTAFNLNTPGHYGVYRGTRKVQGQFVRYICARTGPTSGFWINTNPTGTGTYVTFSDVEVGVVSCAAPEPAGTLRAAARNRIGC
ncbi:hypothetical protein AB0M23_22265 [Streptomyces sp. NPDC052077]|uniref:hypothetical protein n=1 Tax=Streptomyces sp. NPDC052077 TaxID=3154757 RepID=UPI0034353309